MVKELDFNKAIQDEYGQTLAGQGEELIDSLMYGSIAAQRDYGMSREDALALFPHHSYLIEKIYSKEDY